MRKINIIILFVLSAAVLTLSSCRRDPIVYPVSNYYVAIEADTEPSLKAGTDVPVIWSVNFYDTQGGRLVLRTFIRPDSHPSDFPAGGYVSGLEPGDYDILVFNYDTRNTIVEEENWLSRVYARTDNYGYSSGTPVIKMPDHLYVWNARVNVPYVTESDGVHIIYTKPKTVIEQWTVGVTGVKNMSRVRGMTLYVSGQDRGRYIGPDGERFMEKSIIRFNGEVRRRDAATKVDGDDADLYISVPYTTFGRFPGVRVLLTLVIAGPDGSTYTYQEDITDQVDDPGNNERKIDVDAGGIDISIPSGEGFDPRAEEWEPEREEIELS